MTRYRRVAAFCAVAAFTVVVGVPAGGADGTGRDGRAPRTAYSPPLAGPQLVGETAFVDPRGLAADRRGRTYVADGAGSVYRFGAGGRFQRSWPVTSPWGVAVDPAGGRVLVAAGDGVRAFDPDGGPLGTVVRVGVGALEVVRPAGIALTRGGDLLVADPAGDAVKRFRLGADGVPTSVARLARAGCDGVPIERPTDVGASAAGDVWIDDWGNRRLCRGGRGSAWEAVTAPLGGSDFVRPEGLDVSPAGKVVVADGGAGRLVLLGAGGRLRWSVPGPSVGLGPFRHPSDATFAAAGTVMADAGAAAVRTFAPGPRVLVARSIERDVGIAESTKTYGASAVDIDGDSDQDLFIGRHYERPARLLENRGGRFVEIQRGTFDNINHGEGHPKIDRHDCAWADVDRDGRIDGYCVVGAEGGRGVKANELWLQRADGSFVERAAEFGVADRYGRGRQPLFLDANADGRPDLFVGNDFPRADGIASPNRLFVNVDGTHFRNAPEFGLTREIGGSCARSADIDGDGFEDLVVCSNSRLRIYRNVAGARFEDVTDALGVRGFAHDAALADLDRDGDLDLVRVNEVSLIVQLQRDGVFDVPAVSLRIAGGFAVAVGDVGGSPEPDVYVLTGGPNAEAPATAGAPPAADVLLLNDGTGAGFADVPVPRARRGCGQAVVPVDHDGDGLPAFLVLNGQGPCVGPVQLIAFR